MHAEDAHAKQGGFFSKIFGHHDDPTAAVADEAPADPNVIHPEDAAAAGVADLATAATTETDPPAPLEAPTPEAVVSNSTMSDVHAIPKGGHEPVDLTASETPSVAPETPAAEAAADQAPITDEPTPTSEVMAADEPVPSLEASTPDSDTPVLEESAAAEATESTDPDMQALKDAQAAHAANAVQNSQTDTPELTSPEEPTEPSPVDTPSLESPEASHDSFEIPSHPFEPATTEETPVADIEPVAEPSASEEVPSAVEVPDEPTVTAEAPFADAVVSGTDTTSDSSPEPPAPPVEEGQAWQSEQSSKVDEGVPTSEDALSEAPQAASDEKSAEVAGEVSDILSGRGEYVTDSSDPKAKEEDRVVTPNDDSESSVDIAATTGEVKPDDSGETQAALVRLEQHVDELDAGLQKVRDELAALKSRFTK